MAEPDLYEALSERERAILAFLADDLSDREIANRLHLAVKTIKWYNSQLYSKLGVGNRHEAVEQARLLGLLGGESDALDEVLIRHNLPAQITPFIGRQQELNDLARLLADQDTRLVTILAPGGMGKTRLALAAAERQLRRYPDGVFFVPLAPLTSPDDIAATIAEHVGFSFYGSDPPSQQLLDYLRKRSTLLVLDNFEHLLDGAPLVTDIVRTASGVTVLATSREKLNLSGEAVFTLTGLHFPDWETPEAALEYDAVKLFMQSAQMARSDFELQANELDYLAGICRLTAGMPLALVLAARWLDMLTLAQIAAELQQGIDILETEMRDVPERQRSVRASFNYSWALLSEAEREVFMKLSVFRGGFTAEAADAVASANLRQLRRLVDKALVVALPTGRYEVHELLRQYGEERMVQTGEAEVVQQGHSSYYMDFLAARDEDIKGRRQQAGLQEIQTDFENIRQGWLWAVEHQQHGLFSRDTLNCLVNYAELKFSLLDAQMLLDHTLKTLQPEAGESPQMVWSQVAIRRERINMLKGDRIDADVLLDVLNHLRAWEDPHEIAFCLWVLADNMSRQGDATAELAYREECLALRRALGDPFYIAHSLVGLAVAYIKQGVIEEARDCLRESIRLRRVLGDSSNLSLSLAVLADHLLERGNFVEADRLFAEAFGLQDIVGKLPIYAWLETHVAALAFWRGSFELALQHNEAGLAILQHREFMGVRSEAQAVMSFMFSLGGDYEQALALCEHAVAVNMPDNHRKSIYWGIALAACGLGDNEVAGHALHNTLRQAYAFKATIFQWLSLPLAAILLARADQSKRATELLAMAHTAPVELTGWMAHWQLLTDLQRELEAELGADGYAAALERGSQLDLETVVEELLTEFEHSEES